MITLIFFLCLIARLNANDSAMKIFNITSNSSAGTLIGTISSLNSDESNNMSPPFYIVPIIPEDQSLFNKHISIDLDTGKIYTNAKLDPAKQSAFKFSALSISDGQAIVILINVIKINDKVEPKTTSSTTTLATSTTITTKTKLKSNKCTTLEPYSKNKLVNLSESYEENDELNEDSSNQYKCLIIDAKLPFSSLSTEVLSLNESWTGAIVFSCSQDEQANLIYITRGMIEAKLKLGLNLNDVEKIEISPNESKTRAFNLSSFDSSQNRVYLRSKQLSLSLKCKNESEPKRFKLKLNENYDKELNGESDFLLLNRNNFQHFLNLNYFNSLFELNKTNLVLLSLWTPLSSAPNETCLNTTYFNSTTPTGLPKLRNEIINSVLDKTTVKFTLTTPIVDHYFTTSLNRFFSSNLKIYLLTLVGVIFFLVLLLGVVFISLKKKNDILKRSTSEKSMKNRFSFASSSSTNLTYQRKTENSRIYEDDEAENENPKGLAKNLEKKGSFLKNISNMFSNNKLASSTSTNTIDTRASMLDSGSINRNLGDLLTIRSKHSINELNEALRNDQNELRINEDELNMFKNVVPIKTTGLFVYSSGYLNEMGINMMDNLRNIAISSNFMCEAKPNENPNMNHSCNFNANSLLTTSSSNQARPNYTNKFEYMDVDFSKWCDLLDWKLEFNHLSNVFDDLIQLK